MALVRTLAERSRAGGDSASRTLLLVDEPELYLHPQGVEQVRGALKALSQGLYQVVVSTHSPLMIAPEDAPGTVLVYKPAGEGTKARPRLVDAVREALEDGASQQELLFELSRLGEVLFSDRVLLVEGGTEKRLLPELFSRGTGRSLRGARIGFVPLSGGGNVPGSLRILRAMGLDAKAVVDLDFTFREAVRAGFVKADDFRLIAVRGRARACSPDMGFALADDGLPCSRGAISAERAWEMLAKDPEVRSVLEELHAELMNQGVWFWKQGAIETVLGIEGKKPAVHKRFLARLEESDWRECVADPGSLLQCFGWIDGRKSEGDSMLMGRA